MNALWRDGLAGSIPAAACFVAAAGFLFCAVREIFQSWWSAWTALAVFLINPNGLYLQSTAMTEPVFAAALCGILFFSIRFRRTQASADVLAAGFCALMGIWTRYEAWFLAPFCAGYFLLIAKRRWWSAMLFSLVVAIGPMSWLFYNAWLTGNPLDFFNGAGSAKAIQGGAPYPGFHNWRVALLYYSTCVELILGPALFWIAGIGVAAALFRRLWWPVLLLALPPVFYVWSVHSSYLPIHMPGLYPHSWYNTRYGLAALPLAAFSAAALTRTRWSLTVAAVAIVPWATHPWPDYWIAWKESERNSISRRAWTSAAADYLKLHVVPGEHIAAEFNDTIGIFRYAGIDLKQVFHPGDSLLWQAAVQRPDLFLNTTWVVCQRTPSDVLSNAAAHAERYRLVKTIQVAGAPPLDIYHHANSF